MPRNLKPDDLKTGSGKRVPEKGTTVSLTGGGMVGAGPNIGQDAWMSPSGVAPLPRWVRARLNSGGAAGEAVAAHLDQPKGAHKASAISLDGFPEDILPDNVEAAFDEVIGVLPIQPPMIGTWAEGTTFSGIPDWGILKTDDRGLVARGLAPVVMGSQLDPAIYPYYWKDPSPLIDTVNGPFTADGGQDPPTDPYWNSDLDATFMWGTGNGAFFTGAYTRPGTAVNDPVIRTTVLGYRSGIDDDVTALPLRQEVTFSGALYPADRGVLALLHWPPGVRGVAPTVDDFTTQDLTDKVVAAILLGQGILGNACDGGDDDCDDTGACDGDPGGIFSVGVDGDGNYDPYTFPGRASGQYDLTEILNGINNHDGQDLNAPFDGGAGAAAVRQENGVVPAAGQVRLGTDPNAGVLDNTGWGIPVLGANDEAYNPDPSTVANVVAPRIGHKVLGNSIFAMEDPNVPGSYLATNFFRYRLPYLKDYTEVGLKWTPKGADPTSTLETFRFFEVDLPASPAAAALLSLPTAGNYGTPFDEDYFTWQVARYRHTFLMPSTEGKAVEQECGTYWLVHFKKEKDFEAFVRDGIMPWHGTLGYGVYGASTIDTSDPAEGRANLVNQTDSAAPFVSPDGPAPNYGYVAPPYFVRRANVFLDFFASTPAYTGWFDWTPRGTGLDIAMYVSGVASFIARRQSVDAPTIDITDLQAIESTTLFFDRMFRTDDSWLTGDNTVAPAKVDPALLSSPAPAMISFHAWGYGPHPSPPADAPDGPSINIPLDGDTANGLSDPNSPQMPSRVEIPYTHCGPGGGARYSDSNGPQTGDSLQIGIGTGHNITFEGDQSSPAFTELAQPRAFFRRPLGHRTAATAAEPFLAADGHGIPIPPSDDAIIFLHTTSYSPTTGLGNYGNFISGGIPSASPTPLYTTLKDTEERFLDETYRWVSSFVTDAADAGKVANTVYGINGRRHLAGPGMGGWAGGPIEVPVRAGLTASHSADWAYQAWLPRNLHLEDLNALGGAGFDGATPELQVKGWPERNPPLTDRANAPFPSSGLLVYPQRDYRWITDPNIRPNDVVDGIPNPQPDYTTLTAESTYVRAFDAGFKGSVGASGSSFVTIRIDGVSLANFGYSAPGPGSLARLDANANTFLAILVKVPGLTTWMDMGRADGGGPSKQDALLDGAGCQVIGPDTLTGVDPVSGIVYAQVKCHVGPVANLFASTGIEGTTPGEVPVLVKVVMRATAKAFNMENTFDGTSFQGAVTGPGSSYGELRGICGIKIVYPTL